MSKAMATSERPTFKTQQSVDAAVWSVCDILRRSNCASATQYVPEVTWILFLRILDQRERLDAEAAAAVGERYTESLEAPYRWRDWAATPAKGNNGDARGIGWNRRDLTECGTLGSYFNFVNTKLLPYLRGLRERPSANEKQKVISEILSGVERVRVDTEKNFLDVLDKIHTIPDDIDAQHYFMLSQVYEGLLLKMGEKAGDGGQFFTPREIIRAIVAVVNPSVGETIYDPCCGTGGFLAEAFNHLRRKLGTDSTPRHLETLKTNTFFGGRRRTWFTRWRSPTSSSMKSSDQIFGTVTRSPVTRRTTDCFKMPRRIRCRLDQSALRRQRRR